MTFCIGQRLIAFYLSMKRLAAKEIHQQLVAMLSLDIVGGAIVKVLADRPFSSMGESSTLRCLSRYAAHRSLTTLIDSIVHYLHWIPHRLPDDQEPIPASLFRELLLVFQTEQTSDWNNIVTMDES
jgi:hypothetical protein